MVDAAAGSGDGSTAAGDPPGRPADLPKCFQLPPGTGTAGRSDRHRPWGPRSSSAEPRWVVFEAVAGLPVETGSHIRAGSVRARRIRPVRDTADPDPPDELGDGCGFENIGARQ